MFHPSARRLILCFVLAALFFILPTAVGAEDSPSVTTVDALVEAIANAHDGDVILVGDIDFQKMPAGIITVSKSITIRSGKTGNAVFTNATFALSGTATDFAPLNVTFENVDFRGDRAGAPVDTEDAAAVTSKLPGIMNTMCAVMFKMNVNATFTGCTFEGYHYGYGGVMNAIYSSKDNQNVLNLSLERCAFSGNAGNYGGCLYLSGYGNNVTLDARHCTFSENAGAVGGAIFAEDATVNLFACNFLGNAPQTSDATTPSGGALTLIRSESMIEGCLFFENRSAGDGGAIYGEITPFRTMILKNCTLRDNAAETDEGIFLATGETNFSTRATAHLYFSTIVGEQHLDGNAEAFGCFFVREGAERCEPDAENGYCLTVTPYFGEISAPMGAGHLPVPWSGYVVPRGALAAVAGGKFSDTFCEMRVGDNYFGKTTVTLRFGRGESETVELSYGDCFTAPTPERAGYAFVGWLLPDGTALEGNRVFLSGEPDGVTLTAKWQFLLSEHLYLIWAPILSIVLLLTLVYAVKAARKSTVRVPDATPANVVNAWFTADEITLIEEKLPEARTLTGREREVFCEMLEGKKQKEIAYDLGIEVTTVKDFYRKIYAKLGSSGKEEMLKKCSEIVSGRATETLG